MILLNFAHPITAAQQARIEELMQQPVERTIVCPTHFAQARSLPAQVVELVDAIDLTMIEWQTQPLLVNPPGLAAAATCLLAELHGRTGYFVPVVQIQRAEGTLPPRFDVIDVLDLQAVRERARGERSE